MRNLQKQILFVVFSAFALLALSFPAYADDWIAGKLRGAVVTFENGSWTQLHRGDIVSDERLIRTAKNARVQFRRGNETIDLGPDTQISIFDRATERFTIVKQSFGEVSIEAERREVKHFVVQTRFLAAVVKGTRFTVRLDHAGAEVSVQRGQVEVRDVSRKLVVQVMPGQRAGAGSQSRLKVAGFGKLDEVVAFSGSAFSDEVELPLDKDDKGGGSKNGNATAVLGNGKSDDAKSDEAKSDEAKSDDDDSGKSSSGKSKSGKKPSKDDE